MFQSLGFNCNISSEIQLFLVKNDLVQTWFEEETNLGALFIIRPVIGLDDQVALLKPDVILLSGRSVQKTDRMIRVRIPVVPDGLTNDDRTSDG